MKRIFYISIILFFSIGFFSACSNPVTNDDLPVVRSAKNSNLLVFEIGAKDNCGNTEPEGEISYKVGNSYDIIFSENDGFQFDKWEVINKESGAIIKDVISIKDKNAAETSITVLKSAENVLLRAVCKIRPKSTSTIPVFSENGVYSDSVIIVTFDSEISEDSFYFTNEDLKFVTYDSLLQNEESKIYGYIFNNEIFYKNVYVTSSTDENLLKFFEPPVIENGKVLKLFPKIDKKFVLSGEYLDIDVFISPDIVNNEGVALGGDGVQWRYRVNSNTDENPPEFSTFELTYENKKLEPGLTFYPKNHIKEIINYSFSAIDKESGINFLQIESKRIQNNEGIAVDEEPVVEIIKVNDKSEGQFELKNEDGLIQVTFSLFDLSGNQSLNNQSYLIQKDTFVNVNEINLYNANNYNENSLIDVSQLKVVPNTIYWTNKCDDKWGKNNFTAADNLTYTIYWGNEKENLIKFAECKKSENFIDGVWQYTIPELSKNQNTYIKLKVADELGNFSFVEAVIPAVPVTFAYQKISDKNDSYYRLFYSVPEEFILSEEETLKGYLFYSEIDKKNENTTQKNLLKTKIFSENYVDLHISDISLCKFYFQLADISKNNYFLSSINEFSILEANDKKVPAIKEIAIEKGGVNSGKNIATVKYDSEPKYGVSYNLFWGDSENSLVNYEQTQTFEIDSSIKTLYYKTVYVEKETGLTKTGDVFSYDLSLINFDTKAPDVKNYQCICSYKKTDEYTASDYYPIITFDICYDEYEIFNNKAEYKLYTVPVESSSVTFEDISEEKIKSSKYILKTFNPPVIPGETVTVWNNVEGVSKSEYYYFVLYLEDIYGNYSYYPLSYNKNLLENIPVITFKQNEESSDLVDINFAIEKEDNCKNYQVEYSVYNNSDENEGFVVCSTSSESINGKESYLKTKDNICSTNFSDKKDSFYFGFAKALYQTNDDNFYKYTYPIYFYTGTGDSVFCELKDVIDDMNGAQIYCDRPCLVMTYWSSENYEYSIESWETYGVQCNPVYVSAQKDSTKEYEDTFCFYKAVRDDIPMGKYFVIIAHFADGTSKMSRTIYTN